MRVCYDHNNKKEHMIIGTISKHQIPLIMLFDENDVEFICESLAHSLEQAYGIIDFFQMPFDEEYDPFEDE